MTEAYIVTAYQEEDLEMQLNTAIQLAENDGFDVADIKLICSPRDPRDITALVIFKKDGSRTSEE